jgi:hypothetical protein
MQISFINEIFTISLFFPEGVKINFENMKRASDGEALKWKKTTKIRDQVFLAMGIPPAPNTSKMIGHTWK